MTPVVLLILDGFGVAPPGPGNAIYLANPANFNSFLYTYPNTTLKASGEAVGLPAGEVGNTEVGHLNLGAGRIIYQDLPRINMAIADGSFYKNEIFLQSVDHIKKTGGKIHLLGLVGEGTVHSSIEHLYALLYFYKEQKVGNVFIHAITDGRDSPPKSAIATIKELEEKMQSLQMGKIASIIGRYYAMDRDKRWERTEKAYFCLSKAQGEKAPSAQEAVNKAYLENKTDEFIDPTNIIPPGQQPVTITQGDAVVFFNYRIDRPRQLTKAFVLDNFEQEANKTLSFDPYAIKYFKSHLYKEEILTSPFIRGEKIKNLFFVTMTEYEKNLPTHVAFPPFVVHNPLGRIVSDVGLRQLRMSETEKERFVTFYFNGQSEMIYPKEDRLIVPSPKVATYDLQPEMSVFDLSNILVTKIKEKNYQLIVVNIANPDMVGHTGNIEATIKAIKAVDECLGRIVSVGLACQYSIIITADHGNAEQKINPHTGEISTEHTDNPVPFIAINSRLQGRFVKLQSGILADVSPTILNLLEIPKPETMTGRNLLEEIR